jgi:hypothetical protein
MRILPFLPSEHRWRTKMRRTFEPWVGQAVVVQVAVGQVRLSVRGTLLKDRGETLLVTPEIGCDVEIPKTRLLAIEEARRAEKRVPRFLYS